MRAEFIYYFVKNYLKLLQPSKEETITAILLLYFTGIEEHNILNLDSSHELEGQIRNKRDEIKAKEKIKLNFKIIEKTFSNSRLKKQLHELSEKLNLNNNETQAVLALFVLKLLVDKANHLPIFKENYLDRSGWGERIWNCKQISKITFLDDNISESLFEESNLIKSSLITDVRFGSYLISKELYSYLLMPEEYSFNNLLKLETLNISNTYPLETFKNITVPSKDIDLMTLLLAKSLKPVAIAILGLSGQGKTELAKSLSANSGKEVFILPATKTGMKKQINSRRGQLYMASQSLNNNQILIVDECDSLIATDEFRFFQNESHAGAKEIINELLDRRRTNIIFVANENGAHDSFFRRCNYVCWISVPLRKSIPYFLTRESKKYKLNFTKDELDQVEKYHGINLGVIANAITDAIDISISEKEAKENFFQILDSRFSNYKKNIITLIPTKDNK